MIDPERLVFRLITPADQELLATLSQRPDVDRVVGQVGGANRPGSHLFVISDGVTPVGIVGVVRSGALDGEDSELVIALLREAEGRGIATEARQWALNWAFENLYLPRIIACIDNENRPATKLANRLGMYALGPRPLHNETIFVKRRDRAP